MGSYRLIWRCLKREADLAITQSKLIPLVCRLKPTKLPDHYKHLECIDITNWDLSTTDPNFVKMVGAIKDHIRRSSEKHTKSKIRIAVKRDNEAIADRWIRPGEAFQDCYNKQNGSQYHCPQLVLVPPVENGFFMGSTPTGGPEGKDIQPNETPQRLVSIRHWIAVGKHPITYEEWDWAMTQPGGPTHKPVDKWGRGKMPVTNISWQDAKEYTQFLSDYTGFQYRLLSEAEWEYVCRSGTLGFFAFPKMSLDVTRYDARGVCAGSTRTKKLSKRKLKPAEISTPHTNAFGVAGMHGNVWEWVEDFWHDDYSQGHPPADGSVWLENDDPMISKRNRVVRGGCYCSLPQHIRSASRSYRPARLRQGKIGFRVAREIEPLK